MGELGGRTPVSATLSEADSDAAEKFGQIADDVRPSELDGLVLVYGGGTVEVRSDLTLELDELAELFRPFMSVEPLAAGSAPVPERDYAVVSVASADVETLVTELDASSEPHSLYDRLPGRVARLSDADLAIFRREHPQWIVLLRPSDTRVTVLRSEAGHDRTLAEHLAKEPLKMAARAQGLFSLHAAACSFGETGVLLAGPKRSGKTTLLMHLVAGGAAYVGNDAVRIDLRPDGVVGLKPWPHMIRLDEKTIMGNDLLRAAKLIERAAAGDPSLTRGPDGKLELYYPTLATITGRERPEERATLEAIVLPEFDEAWQGAVETEPEPIEAEELRRSLEASLREHQSIRWLPGFDFESAAASDAEGLERLLADPPPAFRVRYGPDSSGLTESIRALLRRSVS